MTPTPPSNSTFQDGSAFGFAGRRRPPNRIPSHFTPPNPQTPITGITPLSDNGVEELSDGEVGDEDEGEEIEDEEEVEGNDLDEGEDEDEEGGIDEGPILPPIGDFEALYRMLVDQNINTVPMEIEPPFEAKALGLKEIGNLASWTVSSCKPGCGVEALRDDDVAQFWQSDGPQPHHLNIHFSRLVSIRSIRIFLDFEADESYTPTKITLLAGTGYHDLIPFSALEFTQPKGWIDVPLEHVGGGTDGKTLRAFLVQVKVIENHQNGKDTHVRGLKIYARDERTGRAVVDVLGQEELRTSKAVSRKSDKIEKACLTEPGWMGEIELR